MPTPMTRRCAWHTVARTVRLAEASVLIQLRQTRRVQQVIDEVTSRYAGRESLLVEYPIGGQTTLAEALESLRTRKWRG